MDPKSKTPDDTSVNIDSSEILIGGKSNDPEKNLSQCHSVHHKSHMNVLGTNLGLHDKKPLTNALSYGPAYVVYLLTHFI
jgi:hypothetical protein